MVAFGARLDCLRGRIRADAFAAGVRHPAALAFCGDLGEEHCRCSWKIGQRQSIRGGG